MAEKELKRELSSRHMQMIALGGTIGVGLFMGAGSTIKWTGPSALLAYAFAGIILYFVMRALGEMLYVDPTTGSFVNYASKYIHPFAGFLTAWSNVFQWLVVGISEVIAVGTYLHYWWPNFPSWVAGIVVVLTLAGANLFSVRAFGELEFWFAFIKVATIVIMIILGLGVILLGVGNNGHPIGFSNLWAHGGFFTGGVKGFFFALSLVMGAYQGVELIGLTAGEAKNPQEAIIKSIRTIVGRVLIFYVGAIFVIVTIYPWNELNAIGSPFVQTFTKVGITVAAGLINFVMLTAAMSGCNSGMFSASRMLYTLGNNHDASPAFTKLSRFKVPYIPVIVLSVGMLIGMLLNELPMAASTNIFVIVYSSSVLPGMVPWFVILISNLKFRRDQANQFPNHPFKMPLFPFSNYFSLIVLVIVVAFMFINQETRISVIVGALYLAVVSAIYVVRAIVTKPKTVTNKKTITN